METLERDYTPKGVRFYYIYKALSHPGMNGYVSPLTLQERLMHVQEAKRKLGSRIEWLCDNMSNQVLDAFGNVPNAEFLTDPEGIVVSRQAWSDPEALRKVLEKRVGPVENPTAVSDLKMDFNVEPPSGGIRTGVVPAVQRSARMAPLRINPVVEKGAAPFYVKLRAEVDRAFLNTGEGKLYLGFHLDRLYEVHWNNLTQPVEFELDLPEGVRVEPAGGVGPKVEEEADKDPREFLLEIFSENVSQSMGLTVRYFACDDANTFCIPVTQQYAIHLERDIHGGSTRSAGRSRRRFRDFRSLLQERDRDSDGKLSLDEVPEPMKRRFRFLDSDEDGFIDEQELQSMARRRRAGSGRAGSWGEQILEADANGDGKISREEARGPLLRQFDRIDENGDGLIDEEEIRAVSQRFRRPR